MGQGASSASAGTGNCCKKEEEKMYVPSLSSSSCSGPGSDVSFPPVRDYSAFIPDECLSHIFSSLASLDRRNCSLVCKRWYEVEGSSRQRITLDANSELSISIPGIFARFDHVTRLVLRCDRRVSSIGDDGLRSIGVHCRNLRKLKIKGCRAITDAGIEEFSRFCKGLQKLSVVSCAFGVSGMNAFLKNCSALEELSVKSLKGLLEASATEAIGSGLSSKKLRRISLKEIYTGHLFVPLIAGSKALQSLKLFRCSGDWDRLLEIITDHVFGLVEIHFERLQVSDKGLTAVSRCANLEVLHLVKTPECTNVGLMAIANSCKKLRKLHIDGWKTNRIGDEGLIAVGRKCLNLQELVLIGLNPTVESLSALASNCHGLERLALCGSETIGDPEISCIAAKCFSLKKLCIKGCPVSDNGIETLVSGCPKLVKVKVKKCRHVTTEGAEWLRANRVSLAVNLDSATTSHTGTLPDLSTNMQSMDLHAPSTSRPPLPKAKFSLFAGRNLVACAFMKVSSVSS
eukprot:TRINITY_DN1783_c0_g1_i1.p1 TRINITY_DN1783_c0_g1~~TRINITY_DN1783_c0_g1_i1.p1  ORF type:complete len:515 (+),score=49.16 TRINITY_DN1783_c0_g1_i1:301-1845(+)